MGPGGGIGKEGGGGGGRGRGGAPFIAFTLLLSLSLGWVYCIMINHGFIHGGNVALLRRGLSLEREERSSGP